MSAVKQTYIYCDGGTECPRQDEDQPAYTVDFTDGNAAQQRSRFADSGWIYRRGKDYCPACAKRLFGTIPRSTPEAR